MFDAYFVIGIVLGALLTTFLVIESLPKTKKAVTLSDGIAMFTRTYAVVASLKICTVITFNSALPLDTGVRLYIFVGGFVTIWVSLGGIVEQFMNAPIKVKRKR